MVSGKACVRAWVAGLAASLISASALAAPSTKIGTAPLISPSAADTYYGGATGTTNGTGASGRAKEIVELARALKGDPDLIYEHIRNNMAISWTYGLSKGAVGVIIDRSGTAFDQAQLMVEMLREAGYIADYKLGTITLSGAQFQAWSGITSAKAACQLLSSGGIPAVINGTTTADCSYGSATISTIELSHAWVSVAIGGVSYVYDPAYKDHAFKAGLNLATATGMTSGMAMGQSASTFTSPLNGLSAYNTAGLNAALATMSASVETYIDANAPSGDIADVVGGKTINAQAIPAGGLRQVSLPYTTNVFRTITWTLPDQYRTKLTLSITKARPTAGPDTIVSNKVVYADEVYGRRLTFEPNFDTSGASFTGALKLTGDMGEALTLASFSNSDNPTYSKGAVTLALNLPYAANSGGYMDATVVRDVSYALPFTIVTGFGDTGRGLIDKWGQRRDSAMPAPADATCKVCLVSYKGQTKGDGRRETLAAIWLADAARAGQLHAAIGKGVFAQHYALGVSAADTIVFQTSNGSFWVTDSFDRLDVETGFSLTSSTADATTRRGAVLAAANTIAALKGSVSAQVSDLPDVSAVATRFAWANNVPAVEDTANGATRWFLEFVNATQAGNAFGYFRTEDLLTTSSTGVHADTNDYHPYSNAEVVGRRQAQADAVAAYVADGFTVVTSHEASLGPGQRIGAFVPASGGQYTHERSAQRGGAMVGVKYDANGEPIEVANILINPAGAFDGGGGGAQIYHQAQYDPATAADVVKGRFVKPRVGDMAVASPAVVTMGQGAFPYRMSAGLTFRGGDVRDQTFDIGAHREPQSGWTSNFTNTLTLSSSALEAMGETDPRAAAMTISAFWAAQDAYRASPDMKREIAGQLINAWWLKSLDSNVATAAIGTDTRQWVRRQNGAWLTPGGAAYGALSQTGSTAAAVWNAAAGGTCGGYWMGAVATRGRSTTGMSFTITQGGGDQQTFGQWTNQIIDSGANTCAVQRGFRMTGWSWPSGVSVSLAYAHLDGNLSKVETLSAVGNNLGKWIRFGPSDFFAASSSTGASLMTMTTAQAGAQVTHTDAAGAVTKFDITTLGTGDFGRVRIDKVYAADNGAAPATQYVYDTLGRVAQTKDRLVLAGSRAPTQYFLADGLRSEILNAVGFSSVVYADLDGRPVRTIDGAGAVSTVAYDGRGRPILTTSPDGDRVQIEYNARNLVTKTTRLARVGSAEAGQTIVTETGWHATLNQPIWTKDGRGAQTDYTYTDGLLTKVQLPPASVGATREEANQYYYSNGLLMSATTPSGLSKSATYAEGTSWETLTNIAAPGQMVAAEYTSLGDAYYVMRQRGGAYGMDYDALRRPTLVVEPQPSGVTFCDSFQPPVQTCSSTPYPGRKPIWTPGVSRVAKRLTYDLLGRVTKVERGSWLNNAFTSLETYTAEYDAVGNQVKRVGPTGVVQMSYDALNRPVCTAVRMNAAVYDALPADACRPSAPGTFGPDRISRVNYDAAGRVVSQESGVGSSLQQVTVRNGYSPGGQRTTLTDGNGNTSAFEYDGFGRLKRLRYPVAPRGSGQVSTTDYEEYGYDANGNRISWRKRSGAVLAYSYDALNRMTLQDLPGTTADDVYYAYLDHGKRLEARLGSASNASYNYLRFDEGGRMLEDTFVQSASMQIGSTASYDPEGNRTFTRFGSFPVTFTYDLAGRLATLQSYQGNTWDPLLIYANLTYGPLNRRAVLGRQNSAATYYSYDPAGRLAGLSHVLADAPAAGSHQSFAYNPAGQLVGQEQKSDPYVWSGQPTTTVNFAHDQLNRDAAIASASGYDADGNLTSDGTRAFTYDALNRLRSVTGGPASVTLNYDAWGRLGSYTAGSTTTTFAYFGPQLAAEYDFGLGNNKLLRSYVSGLGVDEWLMALEETNPGQRQSWFHQDRLGSVIATSDSSGNLTPLTYGPYGEPQSWAGSRLRYTGQMAIPEAQLYHYRARAYDPLMGRFLQTDPIGYNEGPNLYTYVAGDPINAGDPSGTSGRVLDGVTVTGSRYDSRSDGGMIIGGRNNAQTFADNSPRSASWFFWEQMMIQREIQRMKTCEAGMGQANADYKGVARANAAWDMISEVAAANGIDPKLLAAVGLRESNFENIKEKGGGLGRGVFQIDLGAHRGQITEAQAFDVRFAANYAAGILSKNMSYLGQKFPNFTPDQLLQATAASYNFDVDDIHGNPNTIDVGSANDNYGISVLRMMQCFG